MQVIKGKNIGPPGRICESKSKLLCPGWRNCIAQGVIPPSSDVLSKRIPPPGSLRGAVIRSSHS